MTVSNRIIAGFAAITVILIVLGIYAVNQIGAVRATVDEIVNRDIGAMVQLDRISRAETTMVELRSAMVRRFVLAGDRSVDESVGQWRTEASLSQSALAELRQSAESYVESAVSADRGRLWRDLVTALREAEAAMAEGRADGEAQFAAIVAGDRDAVAAGDAALTRDRARSIEQLDKVRSILGQGVQVGREVASSVYESSRLSILVGLIVGALISFGVAVGIRRSIVGPLGGFMEVVERVGQGDLIGQTAATGQDEIGRLGITLNGMVDGLRQLARQSREATENLNAAATEIRASTQEQAASVEEQLAAVQETAATVDEITHSGSQISRRAQEVIAAAQATAQTSDAGIVAVEDTVRSMDAIREQAEAVAQNIVALSEKTQAIGEIIATVNDVSERSHLLALNASIEAAAAGESGRSFAIVAAEMKTLADQAKDATRHVRGLLGEIQRGINSSVMLTEEAVKRVAAGKTRIDTTQTTIEELSGRIQESVQTFQQIVASTNQQQIGIEQVTIALQNIRQASQQTAASTRQLDQAAGDLTGLSRQLLMLVERYRL